MIHLQLAVLALGDIAEALYSFWDPLRGESQFRLCLYGKYEIGENILPPSALLRFAAFGHYRSYAYFLVLRFMFWQMSAQRIGFDIQDESLACRPEDGPGKEGQRWW